MFFFFFKEYKDRAAALQSPVGAEFIPQRLSQRILCVCKEPAVVQMFTLRLLRIWPPCVFVCGEQGALLVLLQHQHLSLPQEEDKTNLREDTPSEEPEMALFSLVATNPQTGRSVLVTQLTPPNAWHSRWVKERRQARLTFARWHVDEPPSVVCRLFEADVNQSRVAALSPSGGVCVWGLGRGGGPQTLKALEGEDWQLARWGEVDTLVIGHQNGDVSLYCCSADPTSSCL